MTGRWSIDARGRGTSGPTNGGVACHQHPGAAT